MKEPIMHFDGPVWRPPYEATSQLLQLTAGCTWHRCKFCTLYGKQRFRMSPISEIEDDLKVIHQFQPRAHRIFLTGANPFPDFITFVRHHIAQIENQRLTYNNWVT
ncbi:MAG: hypothetical protein ACI3ZB_06685 [Prevotella sp.]